MRISDWSSDVCSSDLTVAADLVAGERGLVHDGDAPPGARQRDRRSRTRRSTTDDGDVAGVRRRHQQKIPAPGRYVARKVSCSVWPSGRSEEHTSELQSLMRISYAVFCLQKKKKLKIKILIMNWLEVN